MEENKIATLFHQHLDEQYLRLNYDYWYYYVVKTCFFLYYDQVLKIKYINII